MRLKWILFITVESFFALLFIGFLIYSLRDDSFLRPRDRGEVPARSEAPERDGVGLLTAHRVRSLGGGAVMPSPDGLLAPDDPSLQQIPVLAVWRDTGQPAVGTSVTIHRARGPEPRWRQAAHTDGDGLCVLSCPAPWRAVDLLATHPDGADHRLTVNLPATRPVLVELRRSGALFGTLFQGPELTPLSGADVYLYSADGQLLKQTRSGPDGTYEVTHLVGSGLRLFARFEDLVSDISSPSAGPFRVVGGERRGPCDLVLLPGAEVVGVARDAETGAPIAGAAVTVSFRQRDHLALTDADGAYRLTGLPTQRLQLTARAPGYVRSRTTVTPNREQVVECDFVLKAGGVVRVHVQNPEGAPIARAWVALVADDPMEEPREEQWTDRSGVAVLEGVDLQSPSGILAAREGFESVGPMPRTFQFPAGAQETSVTITLAHVPLGGYFAGVVTDGEGAPIEGAVVQWIRVGGAVAPMTWTDEEGYYFLQVAGDMEQSGLAAFADGFSPDVATGVLPGSETFPAEVNFVLQGAHWLEVLALDPEDEPLEGASVIILHPQEDGIPLPVAGHGEPRQTDEDGLVYFENVPGPELIIMVGIPGYTQIEEGIFPVDQRIELTLQPLGEIWGYVLDLTTHEPIPQFTIVREDSAYWGPEPPPAVEETFSSPDGSFLIEGLMINRYYDLTAYAEGYGPAQILDVQPASDDLFFEEVIFLLAPDMAELGVVVEAESGAPIADARIVQAWFDGPWLEDWDALDESNPQLMDVFETYSDVEGVFVLPDGLLDHTLFILAPGRVRRILTPEVWNALPEDEEGRLVVDLEPGGDVVGRYLRDGRPEAGQRMLLIQDHDDAIENVLLDFLVRPDTLEMMGISETDQAGWFGWDSLPAGYYQVATLLFEGGVALFQHCFDFDLEAGEELELTIAAYPGPYSLTGSLLRTDSTPLSPGVLHLQPEFLWEYSEFGALADADGAYAIHGLNPGWYTVTLIRIDPADGAIATITERIHITEDTVADFIFSPGNLVAGRIEYWPSLFGPWQGMYNQVLLRADDMARAESQGLAPYAIGFIEDGAFQIRGRFQGEYALMLSSATGGDYLDPEVFVYIDNLAGHQDLGPIEIPIVGQVHLSLKYLADQWPDPPIPMTLRLQPDTEHPDMAAPQTIHLRIASHPLERLLEHIPIGAYRVELFIPSYIAQPRSAFILVSPGATVEAPFVLRPGEGPTLEPEY